MGPFDVDDPEVGGLIGDGLDFGSLRVPMPARTPRTFTEPAALIAHLQEIRSRGWSVDDEENEDGVRCVGAAVLDHTRRVVGAVSVSQLTSDPESRGPDEMGPRIAAGALAISHALGAPA